MLAALLPLCASASTVCDKPAPKNLAKIPPFPEARKPNTETYLKVHGTSYNWLVGTMNLQVNPRTLSQKGSCCSCPSSGASTGPSGAWPSWSTLTLRPQGLLKRLEGFRVQKKVVLTLPAGPGTVSGFNEGPVQLGFKRVQGLVWGLGCQKGLGLKGYQLRQTSALGPEPQSRGRTKL